MIGPVAILSDVEKISHPERRVQIDVTGGQKPNSMVAAVITVLSEITHQYVATNPTDPDAVEWAYELWGYDAHGRDG